MAGNAHRKINNLPFVLSRESSYIGVLIDDLIAKVLMNRIVCLLQGASLLLQDNAVCANTIGYQIGLILKNVIKIF